MRTTASGTAIKSPVQGNGWRGLGLILVGLAAFGAAMWLTAGHSTSTEDRVSEARKSLVGSALGIEPVSRAGSWDAPLTPLTTTSRDPIYAQASEQLALDAARRAAERAERAAQEARLIEPR